MLDIQNAKVIINEHTKKYINKLSVLIHINITCKTDTNKHK